MSSIEIAFQKPWFLLLAIPAFAVILLPFFRLPARRRKSFKRIASVVLHMVVVTLLVLIVSGFSLLRREKEQAVMVVADFSHSTKTVQGAIKEHTDQLLELIDKRTPVGVVAFGKDSVYCVELDDKREMKLLQVDGAATDIAGALTYAAEQLPAGQAGRIILLTDGEQTQADAQPVAEALAARGVRLDAMFYDTSVPPDPEVQISNITAPEGVYTGKEAVFTVEVESTTDTNVRLFLYDGDTSLESFEAAAAEGSNIYEMRTTPEVAGVHGYRVMVRGDVDTMEENNESYVALNVAGNPSVLIVAESSNAAMPLEEILKDSCSTTTVMARSVPQSLVELCNYDQVILSNVNYWSLPQGFDQLLEKYVKQYGRSLLTLGGEDTYMFGGMNDTKLEQLLPVELELKENSDAPSVALMLVIDNSGSMTQRGSPNLAMAKQGAINCVEAMTENDYVGLVAFSAVAYLQSKPVIADEDNKAFLSRVISGLGTFNGTKYTDAIRVAHRELMAVDADVRHMIFLSDGQPFDKGYTEAARAAAADGITISTVALGFNGSVLQRIADAGGGRYYNVSNAMDLPKIMVSETEQVAVDSKKLGSFIPQVAVESELGQPGAVLPELKGYLGTELKEDATAWLTVGEKHPLYASWTCENGTVATFTSDLTGVWSSAWLSSPTGVEIIQKMARESMGDAHRESSLEAEVVMQGNTAQVKVITAETGDHELTMTAIAGKDQTTLTLTPTQAGVYEGSMELEKAGVYELMFTQTDQTDAVVDHLGSAVAVSYPKEYDAFANGGDTLLEMLCSYSGGGVFADPEELVKAKAKTAPEVLDPLVLFAVICSMLMLGDIAIRKLRWKDVKNQLQVLFNKQ